MTDAGAEVTLYHLDKQKIKPCRGCLDCWFVTPGRCRLNDDMREILPQIGASDVMVLATPLYVDGMNAAMKGLLDRCIPLLEPYFVVAEGRCRHDRRPECKAGEVVLVSVSGFTELDNFEPLLAHVEAVCRNLGRTFAGALLRPIANSLDELQASGLPVNDVLAAAREAGQELVRDGAIKPQTLARVSRELLSRESYVRAINVHFRQVLEKRAKGRA